MSPCPPCSLDELLPGRLKRAEIPLVLAEPLVHERVELEMDLVETRRECRQADHLKSHLLSAAVTIHSGKPRSIRLAGPGLSQSSERPKSLATRLRASMRSGGSGSALLSDPA